MPVNQLDEHGHPSGVVEQVKVGVIKFDNGSRIIAFSSHPQAMAVYGGDVGLDEFAKHPNAKLLWETAQGRIALGHDLAIWSAHDGEETLFNEFAQEARAACASGLLVPAGPGSWRLPDSSSSLSAGGPQSATRSQNLGHPSSGGVGNSLGQGEVASNIQDPQYGVPASAGQRSGSGRGRSRLRGLSGVEPTRRRLRRRVEIPVPAPDGAVEHAARPARDARVLHARLLHLMLRLLACKRRRLLYCTGSRMTTGISRVVIACCRSR